MRTCIILYTYKLTTKGRYFRETVAACDLQATGFWGLSGFLG